MDLRSPDSIRVLVLEPGERSAVIELSLHVVSLQDRPVYEAISYAWGDTGDTVPISCSRKELSITRSLHDALMHIRVPDRPRILWADPICINQQDLEEKGLQVQMMAKIYSQADRVLIWLGEETEDVKSSFASIATATNLFDEDDPETESTNLLGSRVVLKTIDYDWQHVLNLIKRPWFKRKWVIQEVAFAREAFLICGDCSVSWDILGNLAASLHEKDALRFAESRNYNDSPYHTHWDSVVSIDSTRQEVLTESKINPLLLISRARHFLCTNPRDHIFALSSIASMGRDAQPITIDYTSDVIDVFKHFTMRLIVDQSSLQIRAWSSNLSVASEQFRPSWVPDFANLISPSISTAGEIFSASGYSLPSVRFSHHDDILQLKGKILERTAALVPLFLEIRRKPQPAQVDVDLEPESAPFLLSWQAWYHECRNIAGDLSSPDRYEEFWRTIICDTAQDTNFRAPKEYSEHLMNLEIVLGSSDNNPISFARLFSNPMNDPISSVDVQSKLKSIEIATSCTNKSASGRFCSTASGRLAVAPEATEVGDLICIFYGASLPYVIRPVGLADNGQFVIVGPCYAHGIMDGEAMEMEDLETVEISLV